MSDISILSNNGYLASTWRENPANLLPAYPLGGDLILTQYQTDIYGALVKNSSGNPIVTSSNDLIYSQDFWTYMMQEVFPGVTQVEFNQDTASQIANPVNNAQIITQGAYYVSLFQAAAEDFYYAFFLGRDDLNYAGTTNIPAISVAQWNNLSAIQKQAIIVSYFRSRGPAAATTESLYMGDFNQRYQNILVWVASLLIQIMADLQTSTINSGRLSTRLAQTTQSISTEMGSSAYDYIPVTDPNDFATQHQNAVNTKKLEDLRTFRGLLQSQTDQASADLTQLNNQVEQQGDVALNFNDQAQKIVDRIWKGQLQGR